MRSRKTMTRIIAAVAALVMAAGIIYGVYSLLDKASGEKYYIDINDISDTPITE